jgi:fatty acyl-CoA reductase
LDVNVMGVKHLCQFAKRCADLKLLMHVSTAYVSGDSAAVILEKPMRPGESLRDGVRLDVDSELRLVSDAKKDLPTPPSSGDDANANANATERKAMKELGLLRARHFGWSNTYVFTKAMGEMVLEQHRVDGDLPPAVVIVRPSIITSVRADPLPGWMQGTRTIDTLIIGYAKQSISCFLADLRMVMDVIPGDMVVNAMLAAAAASRSESEERRGVSIYQVTSSLRNPATYGVLYGAGCRHFVEHPRVRDNGEVIPNKEMRFFPTIPEFRLYMVLTFKLPLEILHLANTLLCGLFSKLYHDSNRKYNLVMHLVDVYGPFAFFKGW